MELLLLTESSSTNRRYSYSHLLSNRDLHYSTAARSSKRNILGKLQMCPRGQFGDNAPGGTYVSFCASRIKGT